MNTLNVPNSQLSNIDSGALRTLLGQLSIALAKRSLIGAAILPDGDDATETTANRLRSIINAVQRRETTYGNESVEVDPRLAGTMRRLIAELRDKFREQTEKELGPRKLELLSSLLTHSVPDILDVLGKSEDENSHSDLVRWLLDPRKARSIAPAALTALVSRLERPGEWQSRVASAIDQHALTVRRERAFILESSDEVSQGRFDLLISGPGLKLVIENKVGSEEHDNQTHQYWQWLESQPGLKAGMILSPTGLSAQNLNFKALSYLQLLSCLLEGSIKAQLDLSEEAVLASFAKALAVGILRQELAVMIHRKDVI